MMTLEQYKSKYRGLSESEVNRLIRSDSDFRNATEALYVAYFRTPLNKKCGDCWKDAYILLLRRESSTIMEQTRKYELVAGALLRDVRNMNDDSRLVTRRNLTDELAMYHLGTNPNCIRFFSKYPENWREESAAYVAKLDGKADEKSGDADAAAKAVKSAELSLAKAQSRLKKAKDSGDAEAVKKAEAAVARAEKKLAALAE